MTCHHSFKNILKFFFDCIAFGTIVLLEEGEMISELNQQYYLIWYFSSNKYLKCNSIEDSSVLNMFQIVGALFQMSLRSLSSRIVFIFTMIAAMPCLAQNFLSITFEDL